jgi:glycosyltransferase involved in cell wall biosynthesis
VRTDGPPFDVVHVLDALTDAGPGLWGKERVVAHLMQAQRATGRYRPSLAVFVECSLAALARERGFPVFVLAKKHRRIPIASAKALHAVLAAYDRPALVHSHEYKANVVARYLRRSGTPMRALISTSHAWFDDTRLVAAYNALDRFTARASDGVTVADRGMIRRFARDVHVEFVPNALPDVESGVRTERAAARARFGLPADAFIAGFFARTSIAKGIAVFCDAARASGDRGVTWVVAGSGNRADIARDAMLPNLRYLGFQNDGDAFRSAIDCYVQSSFVEGLSLSLLEAMRAALPIVATDAGSTRFAIRDGIDGIVVAPGDAGAIARAVASIAADPSRAFALGRASRERFESTFRIERQVETFDDIYARAIVRKDAR